MIFLYVDAAGDETLTLKGEHFKYLIKVRRHKEGDTLFFRNHANPDRLYGYEIESIEPRSLHLQLKSTEEKVVAPKEHLHVGWCVIDPKSIEKVLPSLNELGVAQITFIYCKRSQKNFKLDFKRFERIIEASNQQCGRSRGIKLFTCKSIEEFLEKYPGTVVFDFAPRVFEESAGVRDVLIGCEGGFSEDEKLLLENAAVFRLDTPNVLRSETAALAVAAKILL